MGTGPGAEPIRPGTDTVKGDAESTPLVRWNPLPSAHCRCFSTTRYGCIPRPRTCEASRFVGSQPLSSGGCGQHVRSPSVSTSEPLALMTGGYGCALPSAEIHRRPSREHSELLAERIASRCAGTSGSPPAVIHSDTPPAVYAQISSKLVVVLPWKLQLDTYRPGQRVDLLLPCELVGYRPISSYLSKWPVIQECHRGCRIDIEYQVIRNPLAVVFDTQILWAFGHRGGTPFAHLKVIKVRGRWKIYPDVVLIQST